MDDECTKNVEPGGSFPARALYACSGRLLGIQNPLGVVDENRFRDWPAGSDRRAVGHLPFLAPKATHPLRGVSFLVLEMFLFASGALALFASGKPALGWVYTITLIVNKILLTVWK
jgi:hypothetical protein